MQSPDGVRAAMILCAGLGTRLRPLTDELAKPMVPVGDAPLAEHVLERVRRVNPAVVVVNVHHRPDDLSRWAEGEGLVVSRETELLGTAGGIARARDLLGEGAALIWNGDILSDFDPRALVEAHAAAPRGTRATLAVIERPVGEGTVGIGEDGTVVRLRGERFGAEASGGDFLGIHVLSAATRQELPNRGCIVGDVYMPCLRRGERIAAAVVSAPFVDVGSVGSYLGANREWLVRRGVASFSHPSALLRASVSGSVVGAGAIVEAPIDRCVVWPGAHVRRACRDAVVTPRGIVTVASDGNARIVEWTAPETRTNDGEDERPRS